MSVAAQFEAKASDDLSSPFYFNPSHWRAMDGVVEGVKAREGIMVMTGPTGSGKTMLMRAISDSLGEGVTPLFLQYASLNFREFVNFLHNSLDVGDEVLDASNKAVALRKFLYAQAERGETAVVFIDEAQNVEPDVLRMLPKLACFDQLEDGTNVGLQFMLTGGSELSELLKDDDFEEIREAIARRYDLRFFTREELKYFLEKRLAPLARLTPEPITDDAIDTVGKFTGGSPRLMGMICSHAMLFAAENPGRSIDEAMIEEAAEALMIEPVENPFAHESDDDAEFSGPFSSAEIRGGVTSKEPDLDHHFGIESAAEEASMTPMDAPIAPSVDDSYDDESLFDRTTARAEEVEDEQHSLSSVMEQMSIGLDADSDHEDWDDDEFDETEISVGSVGVGAGAGAIGAAAIGASGSMMGRIKSVLSRSKKSDVVGTMEDMADAGGDLLDSGAGAVKGSIGSAAVAGGSVLRSAKSALSRDKGGDAVEAVGGAVEPDFETAGDMMESSTGALKDGVGKIGAKGGSAISGLTSVLSRGQSSDKTQIMGAGRKGRNTQRTAAPTEKRAMKTYVPGRRKQQLKYAGGAAAFCALAFGAYMIRADVSKAVARATDSVKSTASSAYDQVASVGTGAVGSLTAGSSDPLVVDTPNYGSSVDVAGLNTGTINQNIDTAAGNTIPAIPPAPETAAPKVAGGWGARVKVDKTALTLPDIKFPEAPKLPESGVGLARGALDLVESALDKGQQILPDDMKGALDVAKSDVQSLRTAATVNGATTEEQVAKIAQLISDGDDFFARQLYIAPRGGNAYDAYRAALDIDPDNAAATKGLEKLRAFYSKKADAARANRQWDRANRHYGTALAISQRKSVR